jgi:deoxyribodipyrimidine photo-lyase
MLPKIGTKDLEGRIRSLNQKPVNLQGNYVLYWAQMNGRVRGNHALAFAVEMANSGSLPLLVYEGLTCSYPNANDRLHTFLLEGVPDNAKQVTALGAGYVFHLRRRKSDPNDAFYRVAKDAMAIVTDDYPVFVAARHTASAAGKVECPYLAVDASCVVPMQRLEKREYAAYTIRPKITRLLPQYIKPLKIPNVKRKWEEKQPFPQLHTAVRKNAIPSLAAKCEISHDRGCVSGGINRSPRTGV